MGACQFDFQCFSFLTSLSEISFVLSYNVPNSKGDTFNCCENKTTLLKGLPYIVDLRVILKRFIIFYFENTTLGTFKVIL